MDPFTFTHTYRGRVAGLEVARAPGRGSTFCTPERAPKQIRRPAAHALLATHAAPRTQVPDLALERECSCVVCVSLCGEERCGARAVDGKETVSSVLPKRPSWLLRSKHARAQPLVMSSTPPQYGTSSPSSYFPTSTTSSFSSVTPLANNERLPAKGPNEGTGEAVGEGSFFGETGR